METNNIVAAPQVEDFGEIYNIWKRNHIGNMDAFFDFMTTPTPDRDDFINSLSDNTSIDFNESVVAITIKEARNAVEDK
ncbi:hypothetical protein [Muribaculum intestinale]|uniref:hypothetical protein n=1 Tax=Muribaculum intestinale TaxID=1796646 RepID=UPI0025B51275|nr:hypothetical protein [Muribaculum intestinale]